MTKQTELFQLQDSKTLKARRAQMIDNLKLCRVIPVLHFKIANDWSPRICRAVAQSSNGRIIATEKGYILNERATNEEFREANGRIFSQGTKMVERAVKERALRHKLINGGE